MPCASFFITCDLTIPYIISVFFYLTICSILGRIRSLKQGNDLHFFQSELSMKQEIENALNSVELTTNYTTDEIDHHIKSEIEEELKQHGTNVKGILDKKGIDYELHL